MTLLNILSHTYFSNGGEDIRVWVLSKDVSFSVTSFYLFISDASPCTSPLYNIWMMKVSPRIIAFSWLALCRSILTMDNLRWRNRILVNVCRKNL